MKTLRTPRMLALVMIAMIAIMPILARAQSTRFSVSDAFDLKGRMTPVAAYKLKTFEVTGFLGRTDNTFSFDLDAFVSAKDDLKLGLGITHTWTTTLRIADQFRPILGLTLGAWTNYGTGAGKLSGGPYVGATVRF